LSQRRGLLDATFYGSFILAKFSTNFTANFRSRTVSIQFRAHATAICDARSSSIRSTAIERDGKLQPQLCTYGTDVGGPFQCPVGGPDSGRNNDSTNGGSVSVSYGCSVASAVIQSVIGADKETDVDTINDRKPMVVFTYRVIAWTGII